MPRPKGRIYPHLISVKVDEDTWERVKVACDRGQVQTGTLTLSVPKSDLLRHLLKLGIQAYEQEHLQGSEQNVAA